MQYIIVLGNSKDDIMKKRVDRAIAEFNSSPFEYTDPDTGISTKTKMLLFSGGGRDKKNSSESKRMIEYAHTKGMDMEFMIEEPNSLNTIQNLIFSRKLLETCFKPTFYCDKVHITLCTSTFHIKRTMMLSLFLFGTQMCNLEFIHTNEEVTPEQKINEWIHTKNNIDSLLDDKISSIPKIKLNP